jgi:hypothetical protein
MKHEIIYTKHYALIISDENIKDVCKNFLEGDLKTNTLPIYSNTLGESKKIIAYRPLTDAPIFEGIPLLPKFIQEKDVEKLAKDYADDSITRNHEGGFDPGKYVGNYQGFIDGYNKSKETYKYTEEDLINAAKYGYEFRDTTSFPEHKFEDSCINNTKQWLQSLQQQKRPKYFECEMEKVWVRNTDRNAPTLDDFDTIVKTITNSQGQVELVGEYV